MRERFNIINPIAGSGKVALAEKIASQVGGEIYYTKDADDIERFVLAQLEKNPQSHFVIYGGDGSLNDCVNGIMKSGCNKTAAVTAFSLGSGNDFLHYMNNEYLKDNESEEILLDVNEADGKYSINVLNTGFDCTVVSETMKFRNKHHLFGGKLSYTIGVLTTLFKKETFNSKIEITYADGEKEFFEGEWLLAVSANCPYYGGGYKAAPLARPDDGLMDVILVRDVSRFKLISVLLSYKSGAHIIRETATDKCVDVVSKFAGFMTYRRCVSVKMNTAGELCYDGEIHKSGEVEVAVRRMAIKYIPLGVVRSKIGDNSCAGRTVGAV